MRMKRLLTGVLSAALLGATPIALAAAPAEAATATKITAEISKTGARYGDRFYISGKVSTAANGYVSGSVAVQLQRKLAGQSSYSTIATDDSSYFFFGDLKAVGNARYRIVFPGNATYSGSWAEGSQQVMRDLGDKIKNITLKGKVKPDYKRKKVVVEVKKGGKWRKYATVKTNKKGAWSKRLYAARKRTYWRAYTPGEKRFIKSYSTNKYWTIRY